MDYTKHAIAKEDLEVPRSFTHTWSIDFMTDVLSIGTKCRFFTVKDDFNREVLLSIVYYSLKNNRVIWVLRYLINRYGKPHKIWMDNEPKLISKHTKSDPLTRC